MNTYSPLRRLAWGLLPVCLLLALAASPAARAQGAAQTVYTDALQPDWTNWSWAATSLGSTSPTHTGSAAIAVSAGPYQALYLHRSPAFDTTSFDSLHFWINGGPTGGQQLNVQATLNGAWQTPVPLAPLPANAWMEVTIPLSMLGAAGKPNMDGFWIQDSTNTTQPTFYVDDISFHSTAGAATLSVNAGNATNVIDGRLFGINTAIWEGHFGEAATVSLLRNMGTQVLRFPGGQICEDYDWSTNTVGSGTGSTNFATFAKTADAVGAQVYVTVNYGSKTPENAAAWVAYANGYSSNSLVIGVDSQGRDWKTVGFWASLRGAAPLATDDGYNFLRIQRPKPFGFRYWEIGNEPFGWWETCTHGGPNSGLTGTYCDANTYGLYSAQFIQKMKAVDPYAKIGVATIAGEDNWAWHTQHPPVPNPNEGGSLHSGWTSILLTILKEQGTLPDFLEYHRYPQQFNTETDAGLLQSSGTLFVDLQSLRKMLTDYIGGTAAARIEISNTETNSVNGPGKQSVSLVNGLYCADLAGTLTQTEIKTSLWWGFFHENTTYGNNSSSLYGWRQFGDLSLIAGGDRWDTPFNTPYPPYYAYKLLTHWGRGGDHTVSAASDNSLLAVYAAKLKNGNLALLVINKSPTTDFPAHIALAGYAPNPTAAVYSYGKREDITNADLTQTTISSAGTAFDNVFPSYSMTVLVLTPAPPHP